MEAAIINSESKSDLVLLLNLAKKLGIKTKMLTKQEMEDIGLGYAMLEADRGEYVDEKLIPDKLSKKSTDTSPNL